MEGMLGFFIIFFVLMAIWAVFFIVGRSINKKKLINFKNYIQQNLPEFNLKQDKFLFAKQKSKQIRPDIGLLIQEGQEKIIIIREIKKTGITHIQYDYEDLQGVESSNRMISRGLLPKTYSYEEALHVTFNDGSNYHLFLENISNKAGNDQGAMVVKDIFKPWKENLREIANENKK